MQTQENRENFKVAFVTTSHGHISRPKSTTANWGLATTKFVPKTIFGELREQNRKCYLVKAENAIEHKYLSIR